MQQPVPRLSGQFQSRLSKLAAEFLQKVVRQQQHFVSALAQRRNRHRNRRDPEVQIFSKEFFFGQFSQVAIRGYHDSNVYINRLRAAHSFESLFFQHTQELCLNPQRQFSNLIQKKRSAVRQVHLPDLARARPGERAALVPKEFVLHQSFWNCRAIQRHERVIPPRR